MHRSSRLLPLTSPCALAVASACTLLLVAGCAQAPSASARLEAPAAEAACRELPQRAGLAATELKTRYHAAGTRHAGGKPSGQSLPGHCVVTGRIDPRTGVGGRAFATGFELSLPDGWNGRFLYLGGGGNDGRVRDTTLSSSISVATPSPLAQGYAVVSTDAGHDGQDGSFGLDPRARIDHAFDSHHKTALTARALMRTHYGQLPHHSYFSGCSGGGRQGMVFAQRFPELFDGITAGAPAMRVSSGATVAAIWNAQQLEAAAPAGADGQRVLSRAFSDADLKLVARRINAACDGADGVLDGLVSNPSACRFEPQTLHCLPGQAGDCLTAPQVKALKSYFDGPTDRQGRALYFPQPYDPGVAGPGWRAWTLGKSTTAEPDARYVFLMVDALKHEFFTPPDPGFDWRRFNVDTDPARMAWFSAIYDTAEDTRLDRYKARGGKLMFIHGMSDPIFSAVEMLAYYDQLSAHHGGYAATQGFARAYVVPGMNHCSGGPATDQIDSIQAMVDWVERGQAPDRLIARAASDNAWFPGRSRPLCPHPQYPRYTGSGSIEDAANFRCTQP